MVTKKLLIVDPKKIKWEPVEGAANGVRVKPLWTDKKTGAVAALAKLPKGCMHACARGAGI